MKTEKYLMIKLKKEYTVVERLPPDNPEKIRRVDLLSQLALGKSISIRQTAIQLLILLP